MNKQQLSFLDHLYDRCPDLWGLRNRWADGLLRVQALGINDGTDNSYFTYDDGTGQR